MGRGERKRKKKRKIALELHTGHGGFVYGDPRVFPAGRGDGSAGRGAPPGGAVGAGMRRAPRRDPRGPPGAPPAPEMSHLRGFWRLLANQKKKNGARKTIRVYLGWKAPGEAGSAERAPDGFGRAAAPAPPLPGQGVPCRGRARLRGQLLALCASGPPQEPGKVSLFSAVGAAQGEGTGGTGTGRASPHTAAAGRRT